MPRFELRDPQGMGYRLDSADPEIIGRWFYDMMVRMSKEWDLLSPANNMFQLQVWPLWQKSTDPLVPDGPDWCAESRHSNCHDFQFDGTMQGLLEVINAHIEASAESETQKH